jgi:serine/threonine-protein kinase RsbW
MILMAMQPTSPSAPLSQARAVTAADKDRVIEGILSGMESAGYGERDRFAVRMALEEAIDNALEHGNRFDPSKWVNVTWRVERQRVLAVVEDQGAGFDPNKVADPFTPEGQRRPSGRGLLLMRHFLSWLHFNGRGNRVTLCKARER